MDWRYTLTSYKKISDGLQIQDVCVMEATADSDLAVSPTGTINYLEKELYDLIQSDKAIFDFLQNGSLDGIWYWDLDKPENEWMSPKFWEVLGYDPNHMKPLTSEWQDVIFAEDLKNVTSGFNAHCADPNCPFDQIVRYRHKKGHTIWIRCRGIVIRNKKGKPYRMLGAHNNITELKNTEEFEKLSQYKSDFLTNMSHELRTPLNSILVLSQLLSDNVQGNLSEKEVNATSIIHAAGHDLLQLVDGILDISKIEAGHSFLAPETITLQKMMQPIKAQMSILALVKELELIFEIASNCPIHLHTGKPQLEQILKNLISNAIKYTDHGQVRVSLTVSTEKIDGFFDSSEPHLAICVKDTGVGIDASNLTRIFNPFERLEMSAEAARAKQGTGLGLSISQSLALALGGVIFAESEPGEGSAITLHLPYSFNTKPNGQRTQPQAKKGAGALDVGEGKLSAKTYDAKSKKILLVDDDTRNLFALNAVLVKEGYSTCVARTGKEALRQLNENPDIIIMDVIMPEMDGLEAIRKIREQKKLTHLPIIALTAKAMESDKDECLKIGATDYLSKPFDAQVLLSKLRKLLSHEDKNKKSRKHVINAIPAAKE
jgi:PAS domain S-box-containing protein